MSDAPAEKAKKPILPPSRIAVIVFAIVAAVIVIYELRARTAWDHTYKAVANAMAESKHGTYLKDVEQYIEGNPTRVDDKEKENILFTWNGVLKKYHMRLKYGRGGFIERIDQE